MMYTELYQYLLQYKKLPVPGIGTFLLERKPAVTDFPSRLIYAPVYAVSLSGAVQQPGRNFFQWLGQSLDIAEREAVIKFNNFSFDIKNNIGNGGTINWNGVGVLNKGLAGEIKLLPADNLIVEEAVPADKVIRQRAEHTVRVGEQEKTSEEMTELLNKTEAVKSYWWVWAASLALVAMLFLGWYFSEKGMDTDAAANGNKLIPAEAVTTTYQLLQ
jgi:hypothetical protein